ncbi:MAG TPA: DUF4184 family protein [Steroidobacteraceae bacterium]|nr:DUF4184 family protein [Steroidobacteraceae bacterium]
MPFTLAHPAAVLPLRRVRLMRTVPLIIGATTPDVPYYLPWRISKYVPQGATHTLLGTLTLDLPFGMVMLLFVWLLRTQLCAPLGPAARAKCFAALERFGSRPANWMLAPLSLLTGAWTHLAWDSFTHADGWMVSRISALSAPVTFFSYTGQLCHVLQYASSVFGLAVLAIWLARLPMPEPASRNLEGSTGGLLLPGVLLAAAAAAGGVETVEHLVRHIPARYQLFYLLITRTTAWFALLYTVAGIVIVRGRRRAAAAATG